MSEESFEWDSKKNLLNQAKHRVAFAEAQYAFADLHRVIAEDLSHSTGEKRYYCFGKVRGGILTIRFYVPSGHNPNIWSRLLAERKTDL